MLFIHWLDPFCQFMSVTECWNPGSCACWASALELSSIPALTILSLGLTMYFTLVLFLLCISTSASGFQSPRFIDDCFLLTYLCLITVIGVSLCFHFTIMLYRCHSFVWVHVVYVQCMCLGVCACVYVCEFTRQRRVSGILLLLSDIFFLNFMESRVFFI